jgi:hypothetical protein
MLHANHGMIGRSRSSSLTSLDPISRDLYLFPAIRKTCPRANLCRGAVLGLLLPIDPYHLYTIIIDKIQR